MYLLRSRPPFSTFVLRESLVSSKTSAPGELAGAIFVLRRSRAPSRGVGDYTAVADAIQQQEGYYPGSVAYRNNNPGNLKYAGQPGAVGVDPAGFAIFPDYATGYQALLNQISLDASRGLTFSQFTAKYAPDAPANYAANLAAAAGLSPSDPLGGANSSTFDLTSGSPDLASLLAPVGNVNPWLLAGAAAFVAWAVLG